MNVAICYYSVHHGNTKKIVKAIKDNFPDVKLVDATKHDDVDLSRCDVIGFASGIYAGRPGKPLLKIAENSLLDGKKVFFIATSSMRLDSFLKPLRDIAAKKNCEVVGEYQCRGYDTFGPLKLTGGVAKGHPDDAEIAAAVELDAVGCKPQRCRDLRVALTALPQFSDLPFLIACHVKTSRSGLENFSCHQLVKFSDFDRTRRKFPHRGVGEKGGAGNRQIKKRRSAEADRRGQITVE